MLSSRRFLVAGTLLLVCSTFLIGSTPDEEEFRFAVLSAWLQLQAVFDGRMALWTSRLGLGVPLPFTPSFVLHPLAPLLAVLSPVAWARVVLLAHTLIGAAGMWRVARHVGVTPHTASLCVATFLLSAPTQNYIFTDFWPSHYLTWTAAPWVLLFAWRLLASAGKEAARWSVALGLTTGLVLASTNPGHVIVYSVLVACVGIGRARGVLAHTVSIAGAAVVAVAIAAPPLVQLAAERSSFDPVLRLVSLPAPLGASTLWTTFLTPLIPVDPSVPVSRMLFLGGPFAALAIVGAAQFFKRHVDLVLTMGISALMAFSTLLPVPLVSARYQFRDPLTLSAILLAGLALDRLAAGGRARLVRVAMAAQIIVLVLGAWPTLSRTWISDARRAEWIGGGSGIGDVADVLAEVVPADARLAFAPTADEAIYDARHVIDGLGVNALAYRGLTVVNGWFKGVSTGLVSPDERLFYGRVSIPAAAVQSSASLDVLGIRYLLANPDEMVAADLREVRRIPKYGGEFVLYENGDAWPVAFLTEPDVEHLHLAPLRGCEHTRMVCLDLEPIAGRRISGTVSTSQADDSIRATVLSAGSPRLLVVSQMFHAGWTASVDGRPQSVSPVAGGLVGVTVPPGATTVELRYRSTHLGAAYVLSSVTIIACAVALCVIARGRGAIPSAMAPTGTLRSGRHLG